MFGCVVCRFDIPSERARKGAVTCTNDCAREYRRQKRAELASRKCSECGRRLASRKTQKLQEGVLRIEQQAVVSEAGI